MKVGRWMTHLVTSCEPTADLAEVAMIMRREDCGFVPVVDLAGRVEGVITDRDITMAMATRHCRPTALTAMDVMTRDPATVRLEDSVESALKLMGKRKVRRLPVVDQDDRLLGVLSINDIVLHANRAGEAAPGITADQVLEALRGICEHHVPEAPVAEKETLVATKG